MEEAGLQIALLLLALLLVALLLLLLLLWNLFGSTIGKRQCVYSYFLPRARTDSGFALSAASLVPRRARDVAVFRPLLSAVPRSVGDLRDYFQSSECPTLPLIRPAYDRLGVENFHRQVAHVSTSPLSAVCSSALFLVHRTGTEQHTAMMVHALFTSVVLVRAAET